MISLTFGLFTQVSDSGPQGPLVYFLFFKCLNGTIPLTCILAKYSWSNQISKKNSTVRGDCIACDALFDYR